MPKQAGFILLLSLFIATPYAEADEIKIKVIQLKHHTAEELMPVIRPLLGPEGAASGQGYQLVVRETQQRLREIQSVVKDLDIPRRSLRITVRYAAASDTVRAGQGLSGEIRTTDRHDVRADDRTQKARTGLDHHIKRRYSTGRDDQTQFINVLDGQSAFILVGKSIPEVEQFLALAADHLTLIQNVQYRDVTTGFEVLPHVRGDEAELTITPRLSFLTNQGAQVVNFHELSTRTRVKLGEWIDLGGATQSHDKISRAILRSWRTRSAEEWTVRVMVEDTTPTR